MFDLLQFILFQICFKFSSLHWVLKYLLSFWFIILYFVFFLVHWIIHVGLSQSQGGKKVGKDCESGVCWLVWVMEGGDMGLIFVQFSHFCAIKYPSPPEHFPLGNGSLVVLCKVPLTCSTSQSFLLGNPMEQRNYVISSNPFCKPGSTCSTFDRIQPHQQKKCYFPK